MKKTILTVGTAMLFLVGSATFIGCGNSENHGDETHEHAEGEDHNHEDMDMNEHEGMDMTEETQEESDVAYSCPMHPEVTGNEGDTCSECGMDLAKVE